MGSEDDRVELLQGTLEFIVLRALATMGPQHAYGLAARLNQVADHSLPLNQGTLYAALVRLELRGWTKGTWQRTDSNREAKYYAITRAGSAGARTPDGALAAAGRVRRRASRRRGLIHVAHPDPPAQARQHRLAGACRASTVARD